MKIKEIGSNCRAQKFYNEQKHDTIDFFMLQLLPVGFNSLYLFTACEINLNVFQYKTQGRDRSVYEKIGITHS